MISLVLYGRNDNYGYNLHKRAALSLNCMAEILNRPDDEILFVDYNTPDDYPTFPEAIQDTLTEKAKRHLRVLRARPSLHARYAKKTHLLALEPVARNIAVRRANPANQWILSTNTDMIFVPRDGRSLGGIVADLPAGHYGIPRFEIPETLWEGLDRTDAAGVIDSFSRWGWDLHLNEIVLGMSPFRFDGPGDFQLMRRDDLVRLHGFHEAMLLGWHVDANIAKRFSLLYGDVGDLSGAVFGYHCDHTRQVTPAHRRDAVQNSIERFFTTVDRPDVPEQAESWGCPDAEVEEIRLGGRGNAVFLSSLASVLRAPLREPLVSRYLFESWDKVGYAPEHVLPFLLDLFASAPRGMRIGWIGMHGAMLGLFGAAWTASGATAPVVVPRDSPGLLGEVPGAASQALPLDVLLADCDALVFDFADAGGQPLSTAEAAADSPAQLLAATFLEAVLAETARQSDGRAPRRFVGINAIHNRFEGIFNSQVNSARTPFSVRLRHGFVSVAGGALAVENWLRFMVPGDAGTLEGGAILARTGRRDTVAYGPYLHPLPGRYEITVDLETDQDATKSDGWSLDPRALVWGLVATARRTVGDDVLRGAKRSLRERLGDERAAALKRSVVGLVNPAARGGLRPPEVNFEVATENDVLARHRLLGDEVRAGTVLIVVDIPESLFLTPTRNGIELRIHSSGTRAFRITRVEARRIPQTAGTTPAAP